jgi:serine/threonine-protein kinase
MGVVVAAHHLELDERVAIKFLLPEVLDHGEAVARFAREARAAVKIKSEHVAKVTDVGKLENGAPYMVMEYLDGHDLSAWLAQRGALPVEQAVEFVLQACEAIAEAHALGIVHRDLKPANLFVTRRPDGALSVKVLDFGISKMTGLSGPGSAPAMTRTSALMGSPLYMSPEQMQSSRDVDARGDIWALGVILYELISGAPPFVAETMTELVLRVVQGAAPRPLGERRPDAPPGIEQVIFRCLERDRARRYESIAELATALFPYAPPRARTSVERISGVLRASGLSASGLALPPSSEQGKLTSAGTAASWGKTANPKARAPWLALGGAGVVLALAGVGWRLTHEVTPAAASATGEPAVVPKAPATVTATPAVAVSAKASPTPSASALAPAVAAPTAAPSASATRDPMADSTGRVLAPSATHLKTARPAAVAKTTTAVPVPAPAHAAVPTPVPEHTADAPPPRPVPRPADDKPNIFDERK